MIKRIEVDMVLHMRFDTTTVGYGLFWQSSTFKGRFCEEDLKLLSTGKQNSGSSREL
ncbi:hypothetical protein Hdeb2414_s0015g00450141 [Helianthus debilis subsp. tardiflorus]